MSIPYLMSLVAVVATALVGRLVLDSLPVRGAARRLSVVQTALGGVGLAGLAFHCGAMFFRRAIALLPGTRAISGDIRELGNLSIVWYVVAALLVVLALRRQHPVAVALVVVALTGVGVTMYDGGSLRVHLAAIFTSVLVIAVVVAAVVLPPRPQRRLLT